jgi:EcsC protein family
VNGDDFENEEGWSLPVRKLLQGLEWIYEKSMNGVPGIDAGLEELAQSYGEQYCSDDAIDRLINWQIAKAGAAGFITGLGGMLTLPVAIPANLVGVSYVQIRMIGAIAHLRGYDIRTDQVRTLVIGCLVGSAVLDILKDMGISVGTQITRQMILRISGQFLKRINQAVGFRLVTKAGSRGAVNLVKGVPIVGGVLGGSLDAAATKVIGVTAKQVFVPIVREPTGG